jgi:hypothetical protein
MPLQRQPVSINFARGLDTKTDPYQVPLGNFLTLVNSVFDSTGRLTKRPGFALLTTVPSTDATTLTTLNDSLVATGSKLQAYIPENNQWLTQGIVQPVQLSVQSLYKNSNTQTAPDTVVAPSGLALTTFTDSLLGACYIVTDTLSGQVVVQVTQLPATARNARVTILGLFFIIGFMATVAGTPHLRYIAVPMANPSIPGTPTDISTSVQSIISDWDFASTGSAIYFSWQGNDAGGASIRTAYLNQTFVVSAAQITLGHTPKKAISVAIDVTNSTSVIYVNFVDTSFDEAYIYSLSQNLIPILLPQPSVAVNGIQQLGAIAANNLVTVFAEFLNPAGTFSSSNIVENTTLTSTGAFVSSSSNLLSVGLASKPFMINNIIYILVATNSPLQPTYFLIDSMNNIITKLAYTNGGGYSTSFVQPQVSVSGMTAKIAYLFKDQLVSVNKSTNVPGTPTANFYTTTGINLASFTINTMHQYSSEIAASLHLTGGILWQYDGAKPVEHGFFIYPEDLQVIWHTTGGNIHAQPDGVTNTNAYYYQVCYEWTDNNGLLHRSAPSLPIGVTTTGTGTTGSITLVLRNLNLTYKKSVRIVVYRWSIAQQTYYQVTSVTNPVISDPSQDSQLYLDTSSDAQIIGNTILYTTGGVIEDIAAPASIASALFNNRLFLIDAEDPNLLWFSKQVIEAVPVEMSDLLTLFVAPTTGSQGSTGPMAALSAMDDKLIIFKKDAIYYINGNGPDNTGSNSTFSDPIFITSIVGSVNPNSLVQISLGIMFQSDKGIWLLGRDLSTNYIGAPVQGFNSNTVRSAQAIPGTNQVRFILDNSVTLVYDYFGRQWATHTNLLAISSTLYRGAHTYLNSYHSILTEAPGTYLDNSYPVLMSLTTSWINIAGLQGYERFYFGFLLGTYLTPFKLNVQLAYDYESSPSQSILVSPNNFSADWGSEAQWGSGGPWGGPGNVFSARFFPEKQKCESFQVSIQELYDPSFGVAAGAGLTLSGLSLVTGIKKGYRTQSAKKSFG